MTFNSALFAFVCCLISFFSYAELSPEGNVKPYLMPKKHPIKSSLDLLFSSSRPTFNLKTLKKAGFDKAAPRKFTKLIVTRHPDFPGYVFKLYLDAQRPRKGIPEHEFWVRRCRGAEQIQTLIEEWNLHHFFKVPKKWIYPLPHCHKPPSGYFPKSYILIVEDMDLLSESENKAHWRSDAVTEDLLKHLHAVLHELGLRDCAKPDNIPFASDGRIAFIDTQTFGSNRVNYERLTPYLSSKNQSYWKSLTR